ncbi:MAG: hypothetical protein IPK85_09150 [Gemmatimonadetes bacterium]|nr:hypothetical protein [Gemmatimonadota bacterium]
MTHPIAACIRCGGSLEPGFLLDHIGGGSVQSQWFGGEPTPKAAGQAQSRGIGRPVSARRCTACGALELFAP